ncbi:XP_029657756.2uncharacterized protein LOC115231992 isoform X2 [Octopus vulgaris]|uniref:XP_029657756.2uncharacterized protein LOC115231992 isoform X2 n=1 Tax=Octopus vulgaris TaxID=6645 RepID=A0AA36EYK0_OCTVU|nr:XP_029657756.2uncharacterized protein LOC115231992 isoform X2 [Octopus vulgaris]
MAKLCRCVKLNDRFDAQVFTFTLPKSIVREFSPDVFSTEIVYGYHKWNVSFIKSERHLGAYLKLLTSTPGLSCRVDYAFTMLNKDHFTRNESFMEKNCDFNDDKLTHGRKTFIGIQDLSNRNFMQDSGEFLVELEMRSIVSTFEYDLAVPKEAYSRHYINEKLETPYFSFGVFDWSVSLFSPNGAHYTEGKTAVQLNRHTSFHHLCNVKYEIALGEEDIYQTGQITQTLDTSGVGDPLIVAATIFELSQGRMVVPVKVTMTSVVLVSEVTMDALGQSRNRAHCYDRDKQAWMLEGDTSGKHLSFRLYYTDISHVPRKFTRFVCWNVSIIPSAGSIVGSNTSKAVKALDGPFTKYYVQQDLDEGFVMHTDIPVETLQDAENVYYQPNEERKLTVHIEWIGSCLLVRPTYHTIDDVSRVHKHQMLREIMALQAENYALEKQLYSYQQSIAKTNAKNSPVNPVEPSKKLVENGYELELARELSQHLHAGGHKQPSHPTQLSPSPTPQQSHYSSYQHQQAQPAPPPSPQPHQQQPQQQQQQQQQESPRQPPQRQQRQSHQYHHHQQLQEQPKPPSPPTTSQQQQHHYHHHQQQQQSQQQQQYQQYSPQHSPQHSPHHSPHHTPHHHERRTPTRRRHHDTTYRDYNIRN